MRRALLVLLLGGALVAQSFEVATIKPTGEFRGEKFEVQQGGNLLVVGMSLRGLMFMAYQMPREDIVGGPSWADSAKYDILAQPDSRNPRALPMEQYRLRLQKLLADRFQLKTHRETRERAVYNLVRGRGALKLAQAGGTCDGQAMPMSLLASTLRQQLQRPVIDQTGLQGSYCVRLSWTTDEGKAMGFGKNVTGGPSIFTALREVGLELQSGKAPQNVMVIDSASRPSEN